MSHHEHPNDSALTRELRDYLSALAVSERPPLDAITIRGRAYRRRRLAGFAGLGFTGAAAGTALALGLSGLLGAAPATGPITPSTGTIQTAAFTLTSNAKGTTTLTLNDEQVLDPAALQQALTQRGIPALVKTDTWCSSSPAAPNPLNVGVLSIPPASRGSAPTPRGQQPGPLAGPVSGRTVMVINPKAMPSGTEVFFGYFTSGQLSFNLIYTRSHTCTSGQQPPASR